MPFIDNIKFKEILGAAREGNEKAKMIMQAMMKGNGQEDVDRLVNDYYNVGVEEPEVAEQVTSSLQQIPLEDTMDTGCCDEASLEPEFVPETDDVVDISDVLNKETKGLFDECDYKDVSFCDFLKNKKTDANKLSKNADYFKVFDINGRNSYADNAIEQYKNKFNTNLKDIEKSHNDMDKSISIYLQSANDSLDDEFDFDQAKASDAYNGLIDNENAMHSFGRFWDDDDNANVINALKDLMTQYGKKNVIAALNILKGDNDSRRDYLNNEIDANIGKYSKSVDKLLR